MTAFLVLALEHRITNGNEQAPPGPATGIAIIVGVIVLLVLGAIALHLLVARRSRASRGGVQPPRAERETRHAPPFESVEHRS